MIIFLLLKHNFELIYTLKNFNEFKIYLSLTLLEVLVIGLTSFKGMS